MTSINNAIWSRIEQLLTPPESKEGYEQIGVVSLACAGLLVIPGCLTLMVAQVAQVCSRYFSHSGLSSGFGDQVAQGADVWNHFKVDSLVGNSCFPGLDLPDFKYGVATCTYQDSGSENCPNSQWVEWEEKVVPEAERSGKSADLFRRYQTDVGCRQLIERLKKLGVTSYRFSIEWSQIEERFPDNASVRNPSPNMEVYVQLCQDLIEAGIEPVVTLHHFSEPQWFHDTGSFENEYNIHPFVNFACYAVKKLRQVGVKRFCTINEPAIEAFSRYILGSFPASPMANQQAPTTLIGKIFALFERFILKRVTHGTVLNFNRAGNFLQGALRAHNAAYKAIKEAYPDVEVGIVHQYLRFIPVNPILVPITRYFTRLINDVMLQYFKTGVFELSMPFCHIKSEKEEFKTDFVGLQYYVRPLIGLTGPTTAHGAPMTLMPFHEDPEGLYEAIVVTHGHAKKPIIVTENGISTRDEEQRDRYTRRALFAMQKAAETIGAENLKGYYYWCFVRNLEWNMGMNAQDFGAYALQTDGTIASDPKEGMKSFIAVASKVKEVVQKAA
jgi:beta-glucosidase